MLLLYAFGSHKLGDRIRRAGRGPTLQRIVGVIMIVTALAIATDADVRFQTALADHFPDAIVNPTGGLERSDAVAKRLDDLRGESKFESKQAAAEANQPKPGKPSNLEVLGDAPDFTGNQRWFNTPGGKALSLRDLRGRVVLVDFWTYTCINCIRTLPYVHRLGSPLPRQGPDDRRRAHAGVRVREERRQRRRRDQAEPASTIPSPRTTTTRPGTPTATSTGRPST